MNQARRTIDDVLAQHTDDYRTVRELHRVPPHVTWEVRFEGWRAVCKRATGDEGDPTTEARVMEFVGRETDLPVPAVLGVGADYFVAAWLDGLPNDDPREDVEWARTAGATIARLHERTADAFDRTGFPVGGAGAGSSDGSPFELDGHPTWAETVATLLDDRRAYLAGQGRDEYAAVAAEACAFVREHPGAFPDPDVPVLCHGNLLPDHLGVRERGTGTPRIDFVPARPGGSGGDGGDAGVEATALVDFEHALVGHPAYDYWRTALPAFEARERPACERAFREGYASVRSLPDAVDRDADGYRLLNTVSYLRALFLQDQHPPAEAERRADWMAEHIRGTLADLRDRYG